MSAITVMDNIIGVNSDFRLEPHNGKNNAVTDIQI